MKAVSSNNKLILVVNPIAGGTDKTVLVEKVRTILPAKYELEIYTTTGKEDSKAIAKIVHEMKPSRILVMGGDGTIKLVAQIVNEHIPIGILPAGSANGLATDLDLPMDIEEALSVSLSDSIRCIDTLKINDQLSLHISDIGLNAELIQEFDSGKLRGHFGYALNIIPTLIKSDIPYQFKVVANGTTKYLDAVMVAFANSQKFGTGVTINPNGIIDDGYFEVLIFKNLQTLNVIKTLMGQLELDPDFVEVIKTKEVTVSTVEPVCFQIDGEYCDQMTEVHVTLVPKNICIAVR